MNSTAERLTKVKNVYSFWGRFPSLYSLQDYITFLGRPGFIRRTAVNRLYLNKGDSVLEVACGSGRNFSYLEDAVCPSGRIVGFDYSLEMLEASRRLIGGRKWTNITLIQGDAARLNVGNKNFDSVLSVLGVSAVPQWEEALQRCYDILNLEGRLVICDARQFSGFFGFLNPLVKSIYSKFAAWDPSKDIPKKMGEIFGNVKVEEFNFGSFYIAVSVKRN